MSFRFKRLFLNKLGVTENSYEDLLNDLSCYPERRTFCATGRMQGERTMARPSDANLGPPA